MATAKKTIPERPVEAGKIDLLNQGGKWILRQDGKIIDVTSIMISANYSLSRATLNIRALEGR